MKKSIITLAVASAAAMGSVAQADNTTLYGRVAMEFTYQSENVKGAKSDISNAGSRFGIKGSDDIGGGLEAFYKYENRIGEDGGLSTKKLYVGLKGDFGSVSFGKQDLPVDGLSNHTDPFNSASVGNRALGASQDATIALYNADSGALIVDGVNVEIDMLDTASSHSLVYKTPNMSGFTASAAVVIDRSNAKVDTADVAGVGSPAAFGSVVASEAYNSVDSEIDAYNLAVEYANNGIYAGLSYLASGDNDKRAVSLGLGYESGTSAGDFNVGLLVENYRVDINRSVNVIDSSTSPSFLATVVGSEVEYKANYVRVGGQYNVTDMDMVYASVDKLNVKDSDVDPMGVSVGYTHKLSNRTKVWAEYGYQDNDTGSDSDESTVSLGLRTDF